MDRWTLNIVALVGCLLPYLISAEGECWSSLPWIHVTACPAGSYCGYTPNPPTKRYCAPCKSGYFCDGGALIGYCDAGFYCTTGSAVPNPDGKSPSSIGGPCPVGHYCPQGAAFPTPCPPDTYNNLTSQSACKPCPVGYFCPRMGTTSPMKCPQGTYYNFASQPVCIECPAGTYNNLTSQTTCKDCPAGFFCNGRTTEPQPCTPGAFCPVGTTFSIPCPMGTYNDVSGRTALSDCIDCPAGKYCDFGGLVQPAGDCDPGYFCPSGSSSSIENLCPVGHYCPSGSAAAMACPSGQYQDQTGQHSCKICPVGHYCVTGSISPIACPAGQYQEHTGQPSCSICPVDHYCVPGATAPIHCLPGQFQDQTGQSMCKVCKSGQYCPDNASTANTTACLHGWLANEGSCYLFGTSNTQFSNAEHFCTQHGGNLVEMATSHENNFIISFLDQLKAKDWWIGLVKEHSKAWTWHSSNSRVTFADWSPGAQGMQNHTVDPACAVFDKHHNFTWTVVECNSTMATPLCEKRTLCIVWSLVRRRVTLRLTRLQTMNNVLKYWKKW